MNRPSFRTAMAAILAGALFFAGQAGELAFSSAGDGGAVFVAFGAAGIVVLEAAWVALGVALLSAHRRQPHLMSPAGEPAT